MGDITIYCANPIAGRPNENLEYARFMGTLVEAIGAIPLVPQDIQPDDHSGECPPGYALTQDGNHTSACALKADLKVMLDCNAVLFAEDWEGSVGCQFEMQVAQMVGMTILYVRPDGVICNAKDGEEVLSV